MAKKAAKKVRSLADYIKAHPHARPGGCSICQHSRRAEIEDAIREWASLSPIERRNFGVRRLAQYISEEILDGADGTWPGRQTVERHRDICMGIDL